jgi:outer membrane protein
MLHRCAVSLFLCSILVLSVSSDAAARRKTAAKTKPLPSNFRVGLLVDGPLAPDMKRLLERIQEETGLITKGSARRVAFPEQKIKLGDWDPKKIERQADLLLADPEVDMVLAVGFLGAMILGNRSDLPKPIYAPLAADTDYSGLPRKDKVSGKKNFGYLVYNKAFHEDILAFNALVKAKRIHVLADKLVLRSMPNPLAALKQLVASTGIELAVVPIGEGVDSAIAALPKDLENAYITPLVRMTEKDRRALFNELRSRRVRSFSMSGRSEVESGVLATQTRGMDYLRVARRTALNIERIMEGKDPGTFPVDLKRERRLLINMEVAKAIGYSPSWQTRVYAELYKDKIASGKPITLRQAVDEALKRNWDLIASSQGVLANELAVKSAYSKLGPQFDFVFQHQTIHKEAAEASNGTQPWHQGKVAGRLNQFVYIEPILANLDAQKENHKRVLAQHESVRLDIVAHTARAYLNLLKAQANAEIQKSDAQTTVEHLESAKVRRRIGAAGPTDVYRWQSQLANARRVAIQARTMVNAARIQLNRLLRRPQRVPLSPKPLSLNDPSIIPQEAQLAQYLENPLMFGIFSDFMVSECVAHTPELRQLDAAIATKSRLTQSLHRALWLPKVQLTGEISYVAYRQFTDAQPITIPGVGEITLPLSSGPRFNWYVGLGLSVPIFTTFDQTYQARQGDHELLQLRRQRASLVQQIEQRIRTSLNNSRAFRAGIVFSKIAATAAGKNLKVAQDAYLRGVLSAVSLIDAQNQKSAGDLAAATAVYDFHLSLIDLQRASADFEIFNKPSERQAWFERLQKYANKRTAIRAAGVQQ